MRRGGCFDICLYLALPFVTPFILSQGEKGVVLTYVCTWLCLCRSSYGKVRRGGLTYVSTFAFPLSLHSSYRKVKRVSGFNICLYQALPFSLILYLALPFSLISWQGEKGGGFNICLFLAFPLSLHFTYRKVRGGCFNVCLYLALPLSLHPSDGKVKKGGGFNICLYLALPLSVILWQGEKGGFNICLYLALPLSLHWSYAR